MAQEVKPHINIKEIDLGEVKSTDVVPFTIPWNGNARELQYFYRGCGSCTKLTFDEAGKKFDGTLTIANTGYQRTDNTVSKNVTFYLDDGVSEFTADKNGQRIPNPKKKKYSVQLKARVTEITE